MSYLQILRTYPGYIFYSALHFFFSGPGQSFFIALFAIHFKTELNIDSIEFDSIYAGATLGSAVILPLIGKLLDRIKLRVFSLTLGGVFSVFCFLAALVTSQYFLFFVLVGLRLCGQGLMTLTASTSIARFFDKERGKALSLVGFGGSLGEIIFPLLIVALITAFSWQTTWGIIGLSILVIFIPGVILSVKNDSPFQVNPVQNSAKNINNLDFDRKQVLRDPTFYILLMIYAFGPFFITGIFINSDLLAQPKGWSEEMIALSLTVYGGARLASSLLSGPLIDRFSAKSVFAFQIIPSMIGLIAIFLGDHFMILYFFFGCVGISAGLSSVTSGAVWAEIYGITHLGAIRSLVASFMTYSTAAAPILVGWGLKNPNNQGVFYLTMIGVTIFLTLLGFWQTRKLKKN